MKGKHPKKQGLETTLGHYSEHLQLRTSNSLMLPGPCALLSIDSVSCSLSTSESKVFRSCNHSYYATVVRSCDMNDEDWRKLILRHTQPQRP